MAVWTVTKATTPRKIKSGTNHIDWHTTPRKCDTTY